MKKLKLKMIFIVYKSIWINFLDHHKEGKRKTLFIRHFFQTVNCPNQVVENPYTFYRWIYENI